MLVCRINKKANKGLIAFNSMTFLSVIMALILDTGLRIIENHTNLNYNKIHSFILLGIIFSVNFFLIFYKIGISTIEDRFCNESKTNKIISATLTIILLGGAFIPIFIK